MSCGCGLRMKAIDFSRRRLTVITIHLGRMLERIHWYLRYRCGQAVIRRRDGVERYLRVLHRSTGRSMRSIPSSVGRRCGNVHCVHHRRRILLLKAVKQFDTRVLSNAILLHVHARVNRLRRIHNRVWIDGCLSRLLVLAKRAHSLQVASFGFVVRDDVSSEDITSSIGFWTILAAVWLFTSVCACRYMSVWPKKQERRRLTAALMTN